ncbi:putative mitochondrial adenine nucleotide transporter BTL1 [Bienertia sinuspersici]
MTQRSPSQNNKQVVFGDVYGAVMLPKEVELNKAQNLELKFQVPDIGKAFQDVLNTREVGEFLSGALAGAMTKAVLAPLETIRTRMVVGVGSKSIAGSFLQVIEKQGWQGLWAGNAINMLRIVPTQAIELGTFEWVKRAMTATQEKWVSDGDPKLQFGDITISFPFSWLSPVGVAGAAAGIAGPIDCET